MDKLYNKHFYDLNAKEREVYWALISLYELTADLVEYEYERDEEEKIEAFNDAFKNIQDALRIELFTETSKLDILNATYIRKYGNIFREVVDRENGSYVIKPKDTELMFEVIEKLENCSF